MPNRHTITAFRDWIAFVSAIVMVGFLTFVPQHSPIEAPAKISRHAVADWPSKTAELSADATSVR